MLSPLPGCKIVLPKLPVDTEVRVAHKANVIVVAEVFHNDVYDVNTLIENSVHLRQQGGEVELR